MGRDGWLILPMCVCRIKWKPANENSIDFKIHLKFPGSSLPGVLDYTATPRIDLLVWQGEDKYRYFDQLGITDSEWKRTFGAIPIKKLEGRIIECNYDPEIQERYDLPSPWRFMRFRDDKPDGNHQSTVDKVLCSIRDGVSKDEASGTVIIKESEWEGRILIFYIYIYSLSRGFQGYEMLGLSVKRSARSRCMEHTTAAAIDFIITHVHEYHFQPATLCIYKEYHVII